MKNSSPYISVVVPVYNVEKYLGRCVDSILAQTYKSFEIILVDDGSSDGSPQICDEYAEKDERIVVKHKENGGVSSARNVGIYASNGEFVTFVDSDDYIAFNYLEILSKAVEEYSADLIICNYLDVHEDGITKSKSIFSPIVLNRDSALEHFFKKDVFCPVSCGSLFRKSIAERVLFNETIRIAEDGDFLIRYIQKSYVITVLPEQIYYYFIRNDSTVHSGFSEKYYDEIKFGKRLINDFRQNETLFSLTKKYLYNIYKRVLSFSDLQKKEYYALRREFKAFIKSSGLNLSAKEKIRSFLLLHRPTRALLILREKVLSAKYRCKSE